MKLTRKQLRKIIAEAMFDPGTASIGAMERLEDEHGDETADAIRRYHRAGESVAGDELTSSLVGKFFPSEDFEEDAKTFKYMHVRAALPDGYKHLSEDQLEALYNVFGKDIVLGTNVVDAIEVTKFGEMTPVGLGVELPGLGGPDLYKIFDDVYKGNIGLTDQRYSDFSAAQEMVLRAIIMLSNKTHVSPIDSEQMGITVYDQETRGQDIHPNFKDLHEEGKLTFN